MRDPWVLDHSIPSLSTSSNGQVVKRALVASPPRVRPALEPCTMVPSHYPSKHPSEYPTQQQNPLPPPHDGDPKALPPTTMPLPVPVSAVQPSNPLSLSTEENDLDNPYSSSYPYPLPKHDVLAPRPPGYVSTGKLTQT